MYHADGGGQHHVDYYGMKHEVVECIDSDECFVDLNDEHAFQTSHLNDLVTESKVTFYHPDYVLQVPSRQHLINLLDLAAHLRNVSLFILVLFQLRRASVKLDYKFRDGKVTKISVPGRRPSGMCSEVRRIKSTTPFSQSSSTTSTSSKMSL